MTLEGLTLVSTTFIVASGVSLLVGWYFIRAERNMARHRAAMLTATLIGVTVGLISGFYGGKLDLLLMRFTEMNMAIPAILLAIAFAGLMDGKTIHLHPGSLPWHALDLHLNRGLDNKWSCK